jgi:hypothetical protein
MPGRHTLAGSSLLLVLLIAAAAAQGSGSLVRGNTFTVTVVGLPRTAYDIWLSGTSAMTGEPGDQPPVIVPGQVDVVHDPPGGPYAIGNTPVSGGGTILGDVARGTPEVPNTSYYALVTTDASGHGAVLFQTSPATATDRQFHIVAQNPADPGEEVQVVLGGIPTPAQTPVMTLPLPTTMQTPLLPPPATAHTATPVPTTAAIPAPPETPPPAANPAETTPVQEIPLPALTGAAAAGIALLSLGRNARR